MANLFESSNISLQKLSALKQTLIAEEENMKKIEEEQRRQIELNRIKEYQARHIFHTIEEALDWLENNHTKHLIWNDDNVIYNNITQEYTYYGTESDYDGINFWSVTYRYTREELIKKFNDHILRINSKYPEYKEKKWWLDEYNTLKYIHI